MSEAACQVSAFAGSHPACNPATTTSKFSAGADFKPAHHLIRFFNPSTVSTSVAQVWASSPLSDRMNSKSSHAHRGADAVNGTTPHLCHGVVSAFSGSSSLLSRFEQGCANRAGGSLVRQGSLQKQGEEQYNTQ